MNGGALGEAAARYAMQGLRVFPARPYGKVPMTEHGHLDATVDASSIAHWWEAEPSLNVAIATGSHPVVIDIDGPEGAQAWFQLVGENEVPETLTALTGRGSHLYFSTDLVLGNSAGKLGTHIDVRAKGGYVIAPPSVHPNGKTYRWVDPDVAIAKLPAWVEEKLLPPPPPPTLAWRALSPLSRYGEAALREEADKVSRAPEGTRNHTLNAAAFKLGQLLPEGHLSEPDVEVVLLASAGRSGLEERESRRAIRSGLDAGKEQPRTVAPHQVTAGPARRPAPIALTTPRVVASMPSGLASFPLLAMPAGIREYIAATSAAMNVAPDTVAVACLCELSGAVGATVQVEVKQDWYESALLWLALVLRPGASKTPVLAEVTGPLHDRQAEYFEDYRLAMTEFEVEEAAARGAKLPAPSKPTSKRILVSDTTVEKLAELLGDNPRGLLVHRDELTGWIRSMNQYKGAQGPDRSHYLSMWSSSPLLVDRKNSATVHVTKPFVAIVGGIQPEMLGELQDRHGRDDGLLDRVLFACPDVPPAKWTEKCVPLPLRAAWHTLVRSLLQRQLATSEGFPAPLTRRFSAEGKAAWVEMYGDHCNEMNANDLPPQLLGPYSKLSGYAARIALLLHEATQAELGLSPDDPEIDDGIVYAAWAIIDYFKSQQRHVFGLLAQSPQDRRLNSVLRWLVRQGGECTLRDVLRANVGGIGSSEEARDVAVRLEVRGWLTQLAQRGDRGRPSVVLRVTEEGLANGG